MSNPDSYATHRLKWKLTSDTEGNNFWMHVPCGKFPLEGNYYPHSMTTIYKGMLKHEKECECTTLNSPADTE